MISDTYLDRLAFIESSNDPFAVNSKSGAKGLYQFMPATARQYGLEDPFDPDTAREAAREFTRDNYNFLRRKLNREPTKGELYLAHQQGMSGSTALLSNPDKKAVDVLADVYGSKEKARLAVKQNGGDLNMTAGDFAKKWVGKFEEGLVENKKRPPGEPYTEITNAEGEVIMSMGAYPMREQKFTREQLLAEKERRKSSGASGFTREQLLAEKQRRAAASESAAQEPEKVPSVKDRTITENIGRTAARGARSAAAGLAAAGDFVSDIGKLPFQAAGAGMEVFGATDNSVYNFLRDATTGPTLREGVLGYIDRATGNKLQPENMVEAFTDFGIEVLAPAGVLGKLQKTKGAGSQTLQALLDPIETGGRSIMNVRPDSQAFRAAASKVYKRAAEQGGTIKPVAIDRFLVEIENITPKTDLVRNMPDTDPTVLNTVEYLRKNMDGKNLGLDEFQELDQYLSKKINKYVDKTTGFMDEDGGELTMIQNSLRDVVENARPQDLAGDASGFESLKKARELWSTSYRIADIEKILRRAEGRANPDTIIKNGFNAIYSNPAKLKKYPPEVQKLIKEAANTGKYGNILQTMKSRLLPIIGLGSGNPLLSSGLYVGSELARDAATKNQLSRAYDVMDAISGYKPPKPEPFLTQNGKNALNIGVLNTINTAKQRNEEETQ